MKIMELWGIILFLRKCVDTYRYINRSNTRTMYTSKMYRYLIYDSFYFYANLYVYLSFAMYVLNNFRMSYKCDFRQ